MSGAAGLSFDFLATTDVGQRIPDTAEENTGSEMSEGTQERKEKAKGGVRRRRSWGTSFLQERVWLGAMLGVRRGVGFHMLGVCQGGG